jgi:hypothetical protein
MLEAMHARFRLFFSALNEWHQLLPLLLESDVWRIGPNWCADICGGVEL